SVAAGSPLALPGTFTNPDAQAIHATVDYGDGTGPQLLATGDGTFELTHTFAIPGTYAVKVAVSTGFATATRSLTATAPPAAGEPLGVGPDTLPGATQGTSYTQVLSATGGSGAVRFAVTGGATPPGLALAQDGTLTGTPTAAGEYAFVVTATDATGD